MPQQQSAKMTTKVYKKHINIRARYRLPTLLIILLVIAMPISLLFLIVGLQSLSPLLLIGVISLLTITVCLGFLFNYGIKITPKKIRILLESDLKIFYWDEISYVKICFNNSSVIVEVKTKKQACHTFVFGDFSLNRASVFARFLTVRLKTSAKYTEECIEKLSHIPKIKIQNSYKEN